VYYDKISAVKDSALGSVHAQYVLIDGHSATQLPFCSFFDKSLLSLIRIENTPLPLRTMSAIIAIKSF